MSAQFLRLTRIFLYLGLTAPLMPVQAVAVLLNLRLARTLPRWYHRLSCRVLGIRLVFDGKPVEVDPALYVINHNGYLDIEIAIMVDDIERGIDLDRLAVEHQADAQHPARQAMVPARQGAREPQVEQHRDRLHRHQRRRQAEIEEDPRQPQKLCAHNPLVTGSQVTPTFFARRS